MKIAAAVGRRLTGRSPMLPVILVLGLLMPILFLRTAFLVLEYGCITRKVFGGSDAALLLREELMKAFMEAASSSNVDEVEFSVQTSYARPISFKNLVTQMMSNRQDIKAFAIHTKIMMEKMEHMLQTAKLQESVSWHLATHGVPKTLNCLSLNLAQEYAVNAAARSRLPPPQHAHRLTDPSYNHILLLTDNVLAASVVVSSAVKNSANPERLVFHVVTDKKTYPSMHAWFRVSVVDTAVVEVKGLHQYWDWDHHVNVGVKEIVDIHRQMWKQLKYREIKQAAGFEIEYNVDKLDVLSRSSTSSSSLLNHLRIYLPQLFPDLEKVVLLEDDVVVQDDLSSLWEMDLHHKVVGAVVEDYSCSCGCPGRTYHHYFNFTQPIISSNFDQNQCGWLPGINIFDLKRWRITNITATYHQWLKLNLNSGFGLWHPGALPPLLIAFENYIHALDPTWHLAGLGLRNPNVKKDALEGAKVLHFSGPAKPWLQMASPELTRIWYKHLNLSNQHLRACGITG